MPDMLTRLSSVVHFTTTSDDFNAVVRGPGKLEKELSNGDRVPVDTPGFYTLSVADRQLRRVEATLTDKSMPPRSIPPTCPKMDDELVVIAYQVY